MRRLPQMVALGTSGHAPVCELAEACPLVTLPAPRTGRWFGLRRRAVPALGEQIRPVVRADAAHVGPEAVALFGGLDPMKEALSLFRTGVGQVMSNDLSRRERVFSPTV